MNAVESAPTAAPWEALPLCPWERPEDAARYLPIDQAEQAYDEFQKAVASPVTITSRGHLVLVVGETGCGKTSLIHRCTTYLRDQLAASGGKTAIGDCTNDYWEGTSVETRVKRALRRLLDASRPYFFNEDLDALRDASPEGDDIEYAFERLAALCTDLSKRRDDGKEPVTAVLLAPPHASREEFARYATLAGPSRVIFAEISDQDIADECRRLSTTWRSAKVAVTWLEVGRLKEGDGRRLAEGLPHVGNFQPAIPDEIVRVYFEKVIASPGTSVLELAKLTQWVRQRAASRDVEIDDVAAYYQTQYYGFPRVDGSPR